MNDRHIPLIFVRLALAAALAAVASAASYADNEAVSRLWTSQYGTSESDFATGVAVDRAGDAYVVGYTSGSFSGFTNAGGTDVFLAKYDPAGSLQWVRQLGTPAHDRAFAVAVDTSGFVYVAGSTGGDLDGNTNAGGLDAFVIRYSTDGVRQGTIQFGTAQDDEARTVAASSAAVTVAGNTSGAFPTFTNAGGTDVFVARYDIAGTRLWLRQSGSPEDDVATTLAADADGRFYVAGLAGTGFNGVFAAGGSDLFLSKYDGAGTREWTRLDGSTSDDAAYAVAVATDGVYVAATTLGSFPGNTSVGGMDAVLAKYSPGGLRLWARQFGSIRDDRSDGVAVSGQKVFVAGSTRGGIGTASNAGSWDVFVAYYDGTGAALSTLQAGTPPLDIARAAVIDSSGTFFVAGYTGGAFAGGGSFGLEDLFLMKLRAHIVPFLLWTGEGGYTADGLEPETSIGTGLFVYRVRYRDLDGDAPLAGYPRVHVLRGGAETTGSPITLSPVAAGATNYTEGVDYTAGVSLPEGDYTYFFEAFDITGAPAIGLPTVMRAGPRTVPPDARDVRIINGVFKPAEGGSCTFSYTLDRAGEIGVTVYDSLGSTVRELFRGTAPAGTNSVAWDGRTDSGAALPSGVYVIRIAPGGGKQKKAVVIR